MNVPPPPPLQGFQAPLAAPKPHRVDQDMARNLENLGNYAGTPPLPNPPQMQVNYAPGFHSPPPPHHAGYQSPPPGPNPYGGGPPGGPPGGPGGWSPWGGLQAPGPGPALPPGAAPPRSYSTSPQPGYNGGPPPHNLSSSVPSLPMPDHYGTPSLAHSMSTMSLGGASSSSPPPAGPTPNQLTMPLPTVPVLLESINNINSAPPATQIQWCRDVLFLVDKNAATTAALASTYPNSSSTSATEPPMGPVTIDDPQLARLAQVAVPIVLQMASQAPTSGSMSGIPAHVAEALYHRACLTASGAFPEHIKQNPRQAFRDFEGAARGGHGRAWFRIGRDYEAFGDLVHAKECFERGVKNGVPACMYRLGMAHLLGQLNLPALPETALPLLKRAAVASNLDSPQPGYVYALLLLGEFTQYTVPPHMWNQLQLLPPHLAHLGGNQGVLKEAKTHLERSAYLHFAPAQYKLGHAYEFAVTPWEFDALMSVEWYSRASQQGEVEADMALSKWFLCGSGEVAGPGGFEKDEALARVFAEKAARRGLPSAEFAMGYYWEVGVGGEKSVQESIVWYGKAAAHGNTDASDRLAALQQPSPQSLSRAEHDNITENKLVRTRTQAKQKSEAQKVRDGYMERVNQPPGMPQPGAGGYGGPPQPQQHPYRRDSKQVVELIRKNTLGSSAGPPGPPGPPGPGRQGPGGHGRYPTEPPAGPAPQPHHQGSLPPQGYGGPPSGPPKQYPNAHRFTLMDPGSGSANSSPAGSPGPMHAPQPGGRPSHPGHPGRVPSAGPGGGYGPRPGSSGGPGSRPGSAGGPGPYGAEAAPSRPKPSGPQTFAEMGIQGAKAEEKDCVIM